MGKEEEEEGERQVASKQLSEHPHTHAHTRARTHTHRHTHAAKSKGRVRSMVFMGMFTHKGREGWNVRKGMVAVLKTQQRSPAKRERERERERESLSAGLMNWARRAALRRFSDVMRFRLY
jgi:hypothetical protein